MSRRNPAIKGLFTGSQLDQMERTLIRLQHNVTAARIGRWHTTLAQTVAMMLTADDFAALQRVKHLLPPLYGVVDVGFESLGATLQLTFNNDTTTRVGPGVLDVMLPSAAPLCDYVIKWAEIAHAFQKVRRLVRYFHEHPVSCARYYAPWLRQLSNDTPLPESPMSRTFHPTDIGAKLQYIKDSATLITGATLCPEAVQWGYGYASLRLNNQPACKHSTTVSPCNI